MPSFRTRPTAYNKRWHARAKRDGLEYSLGYYTTRDEAIAEERLFAADYPRSINQIGRHQRDTDCPNRA